MSVNRESTLRASRKGRTAIAVGALLSLGLAACTTDANDAITTTTALVSGSVGILIVGVLRDHGWSYGKVMALLASGQLLATLIAWVWYPETAHLELEAINPDDPTLDS